MKEGVGFFLLFFFGLVITLFQTDKKSTVASINNTASDYRFVLPTHTHTHSGDRQRDRQIKTNRYTVLYLKRDRLKENRKKER